MATTNAYSDVYISNLAGSVKIYMDIAPEFRTDIPPPKRLSSSEPCLPGLSGSTIVAGDVVHFDGGAAETAKTIEWHCSKVENDTKTALEALYAENADIIFSFDDGTTEHQAQWGENGLDIRFTKPGRQKRDLYVSLKYVQSLS